MAYLFLGLPEFMFKSTAFAWKHFLFLEESPSGSNTLCYSSVMTFWGSIKVSLGRWYKLTLSLCYSVLKQFPCHLWAVCRMCGRQTSVNNIFEGKRDFALQMLMCLTVFEIRIHSLKKSLNYAFQNELRQTFMVELYDLKVLFQTK